MGFWKCVGCVAAYALGGPIIGTAVTAAVVTSSVKNSEAEDARREGAKEAHAEDALKMQKMQDAMNRISDSVKEANEHYQYIVALTAVGLATANADGEVSQIEIEEMDEFISGVSKSALPSTVKGKITRMRNNPPSFEKAIKEVKKLSAYNPDDFRTVIELVAASDNCITAEEKNLLELWDAEF